MIAPERRMRPDLHYHRHFQARMAMFKPTAGIALMFTLAAANAQAPDPNAPVVTITRQTPTGESPRVFAAKQTALRGSLASKCGLDSVYFTPDDDTDLAIRERMESTVAGEVSDPNVPMPLTRPRKFSGNAPDNDVANTAESSSIPGVGTESTMGPCDVNDRKAAAARESIIRNDKSFADAVAALDAKDYTKAAALLQTAYKKIAYPEAAVLLAKLSLNGQGMPRDTDKALDWLNRAAVGRFDAGRYPTHFNPKDPEAANGMIEGALMLARLYTEGSDGVKKDPAEARKWYLRAAELGSVPALHALGLASGKDIKQARAYFQQAADEGYAPAQYSLGRLYYQGGDGIQQDYALARNWYARAAQSGHAGALYALARMYDLGEGVKVDQAKAYTYYKAAALKADPAAQSALALYYYQGEQVPKNLSTARQLFTEAAMRGDSEAMFNLAVMSAQGEGGDKDLGMAYVWFSLAKANGHERAGQALEGIAKRMSAQDQATADAILKQRAAAPTHGGG
ncbi:hypothetical protein GJ699_27755 [Duganella sp. FT80W]|uniref:Sel1 repeat family protein n=2 Tax=Duganella guangzhouensis TaxID=2666084 RepID=A0A6I2L991_9BURK|nr:hypothetical protein [Duganella guangzhouensis]